MSSSSTDPEPKRTKTTTEAYAENVPDPTDVDNFQRIPATGHPLETASAITVFFVAVDL